MKLPNILSGIFGKRPASPGFLDAIVGTPPNFKYDWSAPSRSEGNWYLMGTFDGQEYFVETVSCFGDKHSVWWIQKQVTLNTQDEIYYLCFGELAADKALFVAQYASGKRDRTPFLMMISAVPFFRELLVGASNFAQMYAAEWPPLHVNHGQAILAWHRKKSNR